MTGRAMPLMRSGICAWALARRSRSAKVRALQQAGAKATDPFDPVASGAEKPRSITIDSGTFAQRPAWSSALPINHVWATGPRTEVVVAGDASIESLVKVAASLQ